MKIIEYTLQVGEDRDGTAMLSTAQIHCGDAQLEEHEAMARAESWDGICTVEDCPDEPAALTVTERLDALEKQTLPGEYTPGTWYYRGDRVLLEGVMYTCIAPSGVVCVWSPAEYPAYWQEG